VHELSLPVAYHVSLDDDGTVEGGEHMLPVAGVHDWFTPYPAFDTVLPLRWRRGSRRKRPDVYWYPPLRHWVCNKRAYRALKSAVRRDIHVIARAEVDGRPARVVQVVGRIEGVVDTAASRFECDIMQWPSFFTSAYERIADRLFGVPEMYLDVFMGIELKEILDDAGVEGLRYTPVDWTNDREWSSPPGDEQATWDLALELGRSSSWPRGVPVGLARLANLLRLDQSVRERGVLFTLALLDADRVHDAAAAAEDLGLPELSAAVRALPPWTKGTVDELEVTYLGLATGDTIRAAFTHRFPDLRTTY
jgi:hypothetical protein